MVCIELKDFRWIRFAYFCYVSPLKEIVPSFVLVIIVVFGQLKHNIFIFSILLLWNFECFFFFLVRMALLSFISSASQIIYFRFFLAWPSIIKWYARPSAQKSPQLSAILQYYKTIFEIRNGITWKTIFKHLHFVIVCLHCIIFEIVCDSISDASKAK